MQLPTDGMTHSLSLHDLTVTLIKHFGVHEGLYELSFEMQMGAGGMADHAGHHLPGAFFMIRQAGLVKVTKRGLNTVDAAQVNPVRPKRAASGKRTAA